MGQVVGKISNIKRVNLAAIQSGGSLANEILGADEVWLVNTTNSLTNSLSGNCDAYIVGDGSTDAKSLNIIPLKEEILYKDVYGYDVTNEVETPQTLKSKSYWNMNNDPLSTGTNASTTIYSCKVEVSEGEIYRIYGTGASAATRFWRTTDSGRYKKRQSGTNINARTTPQEITIETGESLLYVNLVDYDSTTDKVVKVTYNTEHVDGIEEKIEAIEEALGNFTEVDQRLDALESSETTMSLDISTLKNSVPESLWEEVDVENMTSIPMAINTTASEGVYKWGSNRSSSQYLSFRRHSRIKCTEGDKFLILANNSYDCVYAWLTTYCIVDDDYDTAAPLVEDTTPMSITHGTYAYIEAPTGAAFLYIQRSRTSSSGTEYLPSKVFRMGQNVLEPVVPLTLNKIVIGDTNDGFVDGSSSDSVTRIIKVKQGEKIKYHNDYTEGTTTGRPIRIAFSQKLPEIGISCSVVDLAVSYAPHTIFNEYYVAPFDGYFCVSHQYGTVYFTDYKFYRVLKDDNATKPLRNEKIIVFGDSILSFKYAYNKSGFVEHLAQYTGATVIRGSIGGTRLVPRASSNSFYALDISNLIHSWVNNTWTDVDAALENYPDYTGIVNNLKSVRPTEITTIVIDGGGNDLSNSSLAFGDASAASIFNETPTNTTLYGAINYIMRDLFTANPYIRVFWVGGLVGFSSDGVSDRTEERWNDNRTTTIEGNTYTMPQYRAKIAEHVKKWKVPYIDMAELCINPVNFSKFFIDTDNTHPYKGFARMAKIVASQMESKMM